jgi:hypothetical protein
MRALKFPSWVLLCCAVLCCVALPLVACTGVSPYQSGARSPTYQPQHLAQLQQLVRTAESAFAASMAQRDHAAFSQFLSEDAVFFSEDKILRGKQQVAEGWRPYFLKNEAPFSWSADQVEVLDSGTLAHHF